ncbi:MAG: hydroxymethylglutaryl-CoA reductase, degradative [Candidatus Aenigmarchaeota archaeon]|nr:hydroxymethylglutaryl-CoA reductase, degradative [Candidatus Aenigmarchaeota archaeon]
MDNSKLSGFYKKSPEERLKIIKELARLTNEEAEILKKTGSLGMETADRMIENVVGTSELPFGLGLHFLINGKEYVIPMCIEEPSVVAAASFAAKLAKPSGGFETSSSDPVMIGQIQILGFGNFEKAKNSILNNREKILSKANERDSVLINFGGGAKDIEIRRVDSEMGRMLVVHLLVDVRDAMGANAVNTMCEEVSPLLEELTGGYVRLKIISNLADKRLARAKAVWRKKVLEDSTKGLMKGEEVVDAVLEAYHLAANDPYRCATHNKGIMNGVDAVVIATGNDFRAVEAGAHSYASISGRYKPLTRYHKNKEGDLVGEIELPLAIGTVGGATRTKPEAKVALKILGVGSAKELSEIIASVGLAQNFAALRALATEGIQRGHMRLHAKNIAVTAGAKGSEIEKVSKMMIQEKKINVSKAKEILKKIRK